MSRPQTSYDNVTNNILNHSLSGACVSMGAIPNKFMTTTITKPFTIRKNLNAGLPDNLHNVSQGKYKRVLCVCLGGLLRSPTIAWVLSQEPYNCNTRAAGIDSRYSLITVDKRLITWADEIMCCEPGHAALLRQLTNKPIHCLNIPDQFMYREPALIELIKSKVVEHGFKSR